MRSSCKEAPFLLAAAQAILFFTLFIFASTALSQQSVDSYSPGALAIGLGRGGVVEVYDPTALYWNPASMAVRHNPQGFLAIHDPYHVNYLGYSHFTPKYGTFAVSYASTAATKEAVYFGSSGWARRFAPGFYGGLSISGMQQQDSGWGTLGVGLLYKPESSISRPYREDSLFRSPYIMDRLTLGFSIQNLPIGRSDFVHQIRIGASYKFLQGGPTLVYAHHFMPQEDTDHLGLLIEPASSVQVYAGFENFDSKAFAFGAGFSWENIGVQLAYDEMSKRLIFSAVVRVGPHPKAIAGKYYERALNAVKQKEKRAALEFCKYSLIYDENNKKAADLKRLLIPIIEKENVTIDSLLLAAQTFQNQGRFLNAAAQYLKILKIDSNNKEAREAIAMIRPKVNIDAERWYLQAVDYYDKGDIDRAAEIFESIILVRPDHFGSKNYLKKINAYYLKQAEQHYFAGLGFYSQHKLDQAEAEFRKALEISPGYEDASNYLSRISQERQQSRNRIAALLQQANEKEAQGAWKSALGIYKDILRIQPDHSLALARTVDLKRKLENYANRYYRRGVAAYNAGDFAKARGHFQTALSMQPSHSGARRYLQKIASKTTGKTATFIEQAQKYYEQGAWTKAASMADSALAINPQAEEALNIKTKANNMIEAEKLLTTAKDYYSSGQYLEAMQVLDQILEKDENNLVARELLQDCQQKLYDRVDDYFNRGIELYTEEKYAEAIRMWDIVLRINPYHKGALDYKKRAKERMDALESLP